MYAVMPRTSSRKRDASQQPTTASHTTAAAKHSTEVLDATKDLPETTEHSPSQHISKSVEKMTVVSNGASSSPGEFKVTGARMSGVKHSGLLAKDKEKLCSNEIDMKTDEFLPRDLNLSLDSPLGEQTLSLPAIAGRDIYTIGSRGRGGKNLPTPRLKQSVAVETNTAGNREAVSVATKNIITPKGKEEKIGSRLRSSQRTEQSGKRRNQDEESSQSDVFMEVDIEKKSSHKEESEPVQKKRLTRRSTRMRRKVVSSSESELSTDLSEDEELVALASKLNRGAKIGGRALISEEVLEDYFSAHSSKAGITTSDHTLAKLSHPKMDQQSMEEALSETPSRFQHDCLQLYREYEKLYPYWLFQISNGFNILLYGVGSKQKLLEDFRETCLAESCHLVVNGFFPGLTIKQVLSKLTSDVFGHSGTFKSSIEQAQFIAKELKTKCSATSEKESEKSSKKRQSIPLLPISSEIFLLIHNIDGQMLSSDTAQTALSILAQSPHIHIIASVDHINAPRLWDQKKLSRFNWLWHDTTTYEPYHDETSYENSLLVQQSGSLALSSLIHVTNSLTPNARGIFELLVKYQLEYKSETDGLYLGMSFHDCYLKCREKFLVSSDVTLRSQLTEFKDHKLVRSRKGHDGIEYLFIPVDNAALTQFLEHEKEQ